MTNFLHWTVDIPSIVLLLLLLACPFVMWKAQQRPDFDFGLMLTDDTGKPSAMRLAVFVCIAVSTWVMIKVTMTTQNPGEVFNYFLAYMGVWSGAKIVEKLLDVLLAKFGGKP